jgi:hypothetical protein
MGLQALLNFNNIEKGLIKKMSQNMKTDKFWIQYAFQNVWYWCRVGTGVGS